MHRSTILDRSRGELVRAYGALGDPARWAILEKLRVGTRCLCELAADLGMPSNLLSYHMKRLREAGLVVGMKRGRRIEYRMDPARVERLRRELGALANPRARRDRSVVDQS